MKKLTVILIIALLAVFSVGCNTEAVASFTPERMEIAQTDKVIELLDEFMGVNGNERADRTSFGAGERATANYLKNELIEYGYAESTVKIEEFTLSVPQSEFVGSVVQSVLISQNIVVDYNPVGADKFVVVGAHYDNSYSDIPAISAYGNGSHAVADNATGVCTLLAIAKAFIENAPSIDYGIKFAFFGASEVGHLGSDEFIKGVSESNIMLMINLDSIASNKLFLYADETETVQSNLFLGAGKRGYATTFSATPSSIPVAAEIYAENLAYTHFALLSDHASFFEKGIPSLNIYGYDLDGFIYYAPPSDDLYSFKNANANYATAMADTADLVYSTLTHDSFLAESNRFHKPTSSIAFWTGAIWVEIVHLVLVIGGFIALFFVCRHLENKFPPTLFRPKKVRIAVFGSEYENENSGVHIVDTHENEINPFENDGER